MQTLQDERNQSQVQEWTISRKCKNVKKHVEMCRLKGNLRDTQHLLKLRRDNQEPLELALHAAKVGNAMYACLR